MNKQRFTLTAQHVILLRAMWVGWQRCEFGAPEIDPKRPYGNGDVIGDMVEMLDGPDALQKLIDMRDNDEDTSVIRDRYTALHRETERALQVVLSSGSFEPGAYEADEYHINWRKAE